MIKNWAKAEQVKEKAHFESLMNEIIELDAREETVGLNDEERGKRGFLKLNLSTYLKEEEIMWRQKYREKG